MVYPGTVVELRVPGGPETVIYFLLPGGVQEFLYHSRGGILNLKLHPGANIGVQDVFLGLRVLVQSGCLP